jgi:hypothetical protein
MLCSIDDRTGKHSANGLSTNAQRTTVNIPVGGIEKLFFLVSFFFLFLPPKSKED